MRILVKIGTSLMFASCLIKSIFIFQTTSSLEQNVSIFKCFFLTKLYFDDVCFVSFFKMYIRKYIVYLFQKPLLIIICLVLSISGLAKNENFTYNSTFEMSVISLS